MVLDFTESVPGADVRLLHVDDDSMLLNTVADFLKRETEAVEITTETDPEAALGRIDEEEIHCVVSDYQMPEMDGLELLRAVRETHPQLPFILYTGKGSEEIAAQALNAGATGYLQKGGLEQMQRLSNRVEHAVAECRAKIESRRYGRVLQALDYPLYVVDNEPRFQYVNEAFAALTGYDRETIIGSKPGLVKTEANVERSTEALRTVLSGDGRDTEQFEIDIVTKDGDQVPCRDHLAADVRNGEFHASVGILRNRRDDARRRQELLRQNERLEEFAAIVSHDLQTPLQVADTARALARDTGADEHFDRLESAHDRMEQMIDELLTLANGGQSVEEPQPVEIGEMARTAWSDLGVEDHTLTVRTDQTVAGKPTRLRRLFENVLGNAVKHGSGDPSQTRQGADEHGRTVQPKADETITVVVGDCADGFYVADDGRGMPGTAPEQVFESGFTTADDGTGLGLTIVSQIANAHDWEVSVEESEIGGSRFEFTGIGGQPVTATEQTAPETYPE